MEYKVKHNSVNMWGLKYREWEAIWICMGFVFLLSMCCTVCACLSKGVESESKSRHAGLPVRSVDIEETLPEDDHPDETEEHTHPPEPPRHVRTDYGQKYGTHLKEIQVFK